MCLRAMTLEEIELAARDLQARIWRGMSDGQKVIAERSMRNLLDSVGPRAAAEALGVAYFEEEDLRTLFPFRGDRFEPAGVLDRQGNQILVSKAFAVDVMRFTAAHEIGHWVLHRGEVMHRDRPIAGLSTTDIQRRPEEREADHFAACLLMPRKLVKAVFEENFGPTPFEFDEHTAFEFNRKNPQLLLRPSSESLDRELALARAETFGGVPINSLVKVFRVSPVSMAIRIKELGLLPH